MDMNLFTLSVEAYEIVGHILTLGYAAMAASLLFFWLTEQRRQLQTLFTSWIFLESSVKHLKRKLLKCRSHSTDSKQIRKA